MYDTTEARGLIRPINLRAAALLDAVAQTAAGAAEVLREPTPARNGGRLEAERPRDRLGPADRLRTQHHVPETWRIK